MSDNKSRAQLGFIWAECFGVEDSVRQLMETSHHGVFRVLREIGIELDEWILADIFDVDYDGEQFSVGDYGLSYFPDKEVGDILTYKDLYALEEKYQLISDYVKENYQQY